MIFFLNLFYSQVEKSDNIIKIQIEVSNTMFILYQTGSLTMLNYFILFCY